MMKKLIKFTDFSINESSVNSNGDLIDFKLGDTEELTNFAFIDMLDDMLQDSMTASEMPDDMYNDLDSIDHKLKSTYRKYLLDGFAVIICDSENTSMLVDMLKYEYTEFMSVIKAFIDQYSNFGMDNLPFSIEFINVVGPDVQHKLISYLADTAKYEYTISSVELDAFDTKVQDEIVNDFNNVFNIEK